MARFDACGNVKKNTNAFGKKPPRRNRRAHVALGCAGFFSTDHSANLRNVYPAAFFDPWDLGSPARGGISAYIGV